MVYKYFSKMKRVECKWKSMLAIISIFIFSIICADNVNASLQVHRMAGYTQYDTSSAIAKEGWSQSDYAILAFGENFPDALAATPLARKYKAPILLTEAQNLTVITKQTMQDLKVKHVFIVGGTAVVSQAVANQLRDMRIDVTRLAGNDKYDTAIEIAKQIGVVEEITVVTGDDYADALSISAVAALKNSPIILAPKDYLTNSIKNYLSSNTITRTYLVGNLEQINESVSNQFPNVERITGNDKYARNVAVLKRFDTSFDFRNIFLATGDGFADALAGSSYAASKKAPIVLVDSIFNHNTASYLDSKNVLTEQLNVLGGEAVMPSALVRKYSNPKSDSSSTGIIYKSSEIAKMVSPSVVYIEVTDFNGIPTANGSGFIVESTGKVATNYNVIKGGYSAKVKTYDGKIYNVSKVLAYDSKQDLALLKIDATGIQAVTLGDSDKTGTGDKIYTLGTTMGMDNTMSDGIISTKSKIIDGASYIRISAPILPGTSGGVLVNEQAEVVGITTTNVTDGTNLYLSTPVNLLKLTLTEDINLTLAQLPRNSSLTPELTKLTDEDFLDPIHYLNHKDNLKDLKNPYSVMTIAGKSVRFIWKVNNYQSTSSNISINGKINSRDYGNWMDLLANYRGEVMLYFAKLNSEIAAYYSGVSFSGSVVYQDNCTVLPTTSFPYDVSYAGNGSWFVSYPIVTFYDFYTLGKSDAKVIISD